MREGKEKNRRCRLYDEHLVHSIMLSAAIAAAEYLRENPHADSDEICDFIDANAASIIHETVDHLKEMEDIPDKGVEEDFDGDAGEWPSGGGKE